MADPMRIGAPEINDPEREAIKRKIVTALSDSNTTVFKREKRDTGIHANSSLLIQGGLELETSTTFYPTGYSDCLTAKYNGNTVFADGQMSDNIFIRGEWEALLDQHLAQLESDRRADGSP